VSLTTADRATITIADQFFPHRTQRATTCDYNRTYVTARINDNDLAPGAPQVQLGDLANINVNICQHQCQHQCRHVSEANQQATIKDYILTTAGAGIAPGMNVTVRIQKA
jgi:hypothetical protein